MTPPTMPLPPPTFDSDHEARMRSSPFPHYDPDQHPWAPSPPSQVCCVCASELVLHSLFTGVNGV